MGLSTTDISLGYGAIVGIGLESVWGTGVNPTIWLPLISFSPTEEYSQVPRPHLHGGIGRVATGFFTERHDAGGTIKVELSYSAIGLLLRGAMGRLPTTTGSGPYTHPFYLGNVLPSLTIRVYRGAFANGTGTDRYTELQGAKVNRLTISMRAGEVATAEIELIAKTMAYGSQATPTVTYPNPVLYHQAGNITWNSASYDGNQVELTINNGLQRRRNIGSLQTAEPHPSALREIMLRLQRDHCEETLIAALTAVTESDLSITMTGTGNESMTIDLHSARVASPAAVGVSDGGFGAMPETVEFVPRNVPGGTDYGLDITVVNDVSSYAG